MSQINVGLIGFGTVGAGMVELLLHNQELIQGRVGEEIVVKKIADLDIVSDRGVDIAPELLTTNALEIINDPEIDVIVELIGGYDQAMKYIFCLLYTSPSPRD